MSFGYLHGLTTPGAPDEIVDWFATFELWMIATLGWTVARRVNATNIYFRSLSEAGGLTMLFLHVFSAAPGWIWINAAVDTIPTHQTTEDSKLATGGAQFEYWMSGDMDAINVCFKAGVGYRSVYAGMVIPFALTVPDETYRMIATSQIDRASILRNYDDVWDVDINCYPHDRWPMLNWDQYDISVQICGVWAGDAPNIAGQLKHISGGLSTAAVLDTLTTAGQGEAETDWIILQDNVPNRYAMRTGGVEPTGVSMQGAHFAVTSGVAANWADLLDLLSAHLVAIGWQDLGDPGIWSFGREFYTPGESGEDALWCAVTVNNAAPDEVRPYIWDDAGHTHAGGALTHLDDTEFPANYWLTADRDCFMLAVERPLGVYMWLWAGISEPFAPGLFPPYGGAPLTPYRGICAAVTGGNCLRRHDAVWGGGLVLTDGAPANTSPNSFDGATYNVWPHAGFRDLGGGWHEPYGLMKYMFGVSGGGISNMDRIPVGGQVYTVFFEAGGNPFAMRTT